VLPPHPERNADVPHYFFHIHDGKDLIDREGLHLPDDGAARREAIRHAGRIIDDEAASIARGEDWHMEVADAGGLILLRLDFHVTDAPVVRRGHDVRTSSS